MNLQAPSPSYGRGCFGTSPEACSARRRKHVETARKWAQSAVATDPDFIKAVVAAGFQAIPAEERPALLEYLGRRVEA